MIDFNDPAQMMNQGQRILIDTPEAYMATKDAAKGVYFASGRPWDADAEQQFDARVRNGLDANAIIQLTLQDRKARFDEQ